MITHQILHCGGEMSLYVTIRGLDHRPLTSLDYIRIWDSPRKLLTKVCFSYRNLCKLHFSLENADIRLILRKSCFPCDMHSDIKNMPLSWAVEYYTKIKELDNLICELIMIF